MLTQPPLSDSDKLKHAQHQAHAAADAAERAWYDYAALLDVGPARTRAFEVYENLRHSRRVG